MGRSKKAIANTIAGAVDELATFICGLILPRLILGAFGSSYNGITSSINQFISIVALLEAGVFGVSKVALFKPLADKDNKTISEVVIQTERFFRKIALIFIAFSFVFASIYPIFICKNFPWSFSFTLVLIISLPRFAQYLFGMAYQVLLSADQRIYVRYYVNAATTVANTILAALLITFGSSIHIVKLGSAVAYVISPIVLLIYSRKKYQIDKKVIPSKDYLAQRWDALGHEVAEFVNNNTDIMVLTIFANLLEVSVYTVYFAVTHGIKAIVRIFVNGFGAAFGDMYVKKEYDLMRENLKIYEMIVFSISTILYSVTMVMIVPYAKLYTAGITDVDYERPLFAIVLVSASLVSCFRIPYETLTKSVGHYKQTRNGAFLEAGINIVLSIIMVKNFGIIGVAIGTLIAGCFRTTQYALYISDHIIKRSRLIFLRRVSFAAIVVTGVYLLSKLYIAVPDTILLWVLKACITTALAGIITLIFVLLFDRKELFAMFKKIHIKR